ncbi:MAG: AMP-binding protein [Rikenellaceae bacterium]
MSAFLVDNSSVVSYDSLFAQINKANKFIETYRTDSLYDYFCNFLTALCNDKSLTLVDSDTKLDEIDGLSETDINCEQDIIGKAFENIDGVIQAIRNSKSRITIYTSGTTGQPKKVIHTVATLTRSTRISESYTDNVWAYAYNPTHMAGLQVFFQAFCNKNIIVNVFGKNRGDIYGLIKQYNVTHVSATPTFYRLLLPKEEIFAKVQRVTLGGEKSEVNLYHTIQDIFPNAKLNNIYASTEAGSLFVAKGENFQIPEKLKDKFKVIDNELLIHKSLLGESDSFIIANDFYHSGDIIEWIEENKGVFKFKSRKNELINVGGYKVNPHEVEDVLLSINGINQAVVYGKKNSVLGNVLCAEVKLEDNTQISELKIREILSSKLQDYKIPRRIKFVEEFELTRTGKVKRK